MVLEQDISYLFFEPWVVRSSLCSSDILLWDVDLRGCQLVHRCATGGCQFLNGKLAVKVEK